MSEERSATMPREALRAGSQRAVASSGFQSWSAWQEEQLHRRFSELYGLLAAA